ncbi:MAG: MBL fold metallo-hydrolase [Candidatus Aminicenantes bacterium]|nr:MBL fold metallo-hydrolase [Candidatus Aminicenantes bacterium]
MAIPFGRVQVAVHNHGFYRLDGGAMFGTVPKTIWSRLMPPDDDNCIRLATRSLLIKDGPRVFMADIGCGEKWPEKLRRIYAIENFPAMETDLESGPVTDIVLSHLHFDHAGGLSRFKPGSTTDVELSHPRARVYVQSANYETARAPNPRERASYLKENVLVLEQARLELTRGSQEIYPDIWVHQNNGHTRGQQWLEVKNGAESIVFPADLIPTSAHLPIPYSMGYDISTETLLREKEEFLGRAVAGRWIVVFCHDPNVPAARLEMDEKGRTVVEETVSFG